jgi:GST-like protein
LIVDQDEPGGAPCSVFESGAILMYLAEKTGMLMPPETAARYLVIQWLMLQIRGTGPILGQAHHFLKFAPEKVPYAMERYAKAAIRLCGVMDARLAEVEYLPGAYSIADIACWVWSMTSAWQGVDMAGYPHAKRWFDEIGAWPAVQRDLKVSE